MRTTLRPITATAFVILLLSGCSGESELPPVGPDVEATSQAPSAVPEETTNPEPEQPTLTVADPADYDTSAMFSHAEAYSFTDPTENLTCSIFGPGYVSGVTVGCHGTFDETALVPSPDGDGSEVGATGVVMTAESAELAWLGDPAFIPWDDDAGDWYAPAVLPYGTVLEVYGARCLTDPDDGLLCDLGAHFMRVSPDSHELR